MRGAIERLLFKSLGHCGVQTKSEPHLSYVVNDKSNNSVPIWIFGFARSGTTTAQAILSQEFNYNSCFEPFGYKEASNLQSIQAHNLFLGNPKAEDWDIYVSSNGVNSSLSTFNNSSVGAEKRRVFYQYIDKIYKTYGCNSVIKEIRLFGNLEAVQEYHHDRNMPWVCIGILAHPLQPLYTYYRLGGLCNRSEHANLRVMDLYNYRIETYKRMNLYDEFINLPVNSLSDCLVISSMMDSEKISEFVREKSVKGFACNLTTLRQYLSDIGREVGRAPNYSSNSIIIRDSKRYIQDKYFWKCVVEKLSPQVKEILEKKWGLSNLELDFKPAMRKKITSLRHSLFD